MKTSSFLVRPAIFDEVGPQGPCYWKNRTSDSSFSFVIGSMPRDVAMAGWVDLLCKVEQPVNGSCGRKRGDCGRSAMYSH